MELPSDHKPSGSKEMESLAVADPTVLSDEEHQGTIDIQCNYCVCEAVNQGKGTMRLETLCEAMGVKVLNLSIKWECCKK